MVLGETCKMAATWADRRKLAVLGAGRGDWLCIGTSLDALGVPGARHRPRPRPLSTSISRPARISTGHGSLALSGIATDAASEPQVCRRSAGPPVGQLSATCGPRRSPCPDRGLRCVLIARL